MTVLRDCRVRIIINELQTINQTVLLHISKEHLRVIINSLRDTSVDN